MKTTENNKYWQLLKGFKKPILINIAERNTGKKIAICDKYFRDDERIGIASYDKESDEWSFYVKRNNQFVETEVGPNVHIANRISQVIDNIVVQFANESDDYEYGMKPHITYMGEESCIDFMRKRMFKLCFGAIRTSNGLKYVARMDYSGEWHIL